MCILVYNSSLIDQNTAQEVKALRGGSALCFVAFWNLMQGCIAKTFFREPSPWRVPLALASRRLAPANLACAECRRCPACPAHTHIMVNATLIQLANTDQRTLI